MRWAAVTSTPGLYAGARAEHPGFGSVEALALLGMRISGRGAVLDRATQASGVTGAPATDIVSVG